MTEGPGTTELRPLQVEMNGINVISESERKGHPRDLFWPWFAANISVLGLSYGAFVLGFGISFWQARNDSTIPTTPTTSAWANEMPKPSTNAP